MTNASTLGDMSGTLQVVKRAKRGQKDGSTLAHVIDVPALGAGATPSLARASAARAADLRNAGRQPAGMPTVLDDRQRPLL